MARNYDVVKKLCSSANEIIKNSDIATKVGKLDEWSRENNDLTAYISFEVNNFKLNTSSADTKQHYAISFENQKTGAGQGNKFTIKIVFNKDFDANNRTILEFEEALAGANVSNPALRSRCSLEYGYLLDNVPQELKPTKYYGMLLQYDVTANKQLVEYTLYGVSGEQTASLATVNWYPRLEGIEKDDVAWVDLQALSISALDSDDLKGNYDRKIQEFNAAFNNPIKINPFEALCRFVYDYNDYIKRVCDTKRNLACVQFKIVDETGLGFTSGVSNLTQELKPVNISVCRNQTAIEYIQYLIGLFQIKYKQDDYYMQYYQKNNEVVDRFVMEFKYDSVGMSGSTNGNFYIKIVIRRLQSRSSDNSVAYTFSNYTPNNRMLLDFTLRYDGTVALAARSNYEEEASEEEETDKRIYINSDGKIVAKATLTKNMFVAGSYDRVLIEESNTWLDRISCSNNATIKTIGMPFEIPIGTVFGVQSYIGETLHHTSGRCYVVGVVDKIQNNMFTTEMTLVRLPGAYNGIQDI